MTMDAPGAPPPPSSSPPAAAWGGGRSPAPPGGWLVGVVGCSRAHAWRQHRVALAATSRACALSQRSRRGLSHALSPTIAYDRLRSSQLTHHATRPPQAPRRGTNRTIKRLFLFTH
jgi:hypothetical protein